MTETNNQVKFGVKIDTAKRLRLLSEKSGFPISEIISEWSKIADTIPDSADRIVFMQTLKMENRSQLNMLSPLWVGRIPNVPTETSEEDVDKLIKVDYEKKRKKDD